MLTRDRLTQKSGDYNTGFAPKEVIQLDTRETYIKNAREMRRRAEGQEVKE